MTDPLGLLAVHDVAVGNFVDLVRGLPAETWHQETDLAGWTVGDVVAHTAHLEAVLAGAPEETVVVPDELAHVTGPMGRYTEQGVIARRGHDRDLLLDEITMAVAARHAETRADPPTDLSVAAARTPGNIGWSWATLLGNRPVDVVMHEQDLRRAVGRPGNLDGVAAQHVVAVFASGLGFVLGKRVGAPVGTTVAVDLTDSGRRLAATVDDDGRGRPATEDDAPDVTLSMDTETFLVLSGGRRDPATQVVGVSGDEALGRRFLAVMAVTP